MPPLRPPASLLPFAVALAASVVGCGGPVRTVTLRMAGTPPFATVTIDDEPVGSLALVASKGVALPPGNHRISVEAPGFFPLDREVLAPPGGAPLRLDVALLAIPD